MFIFVAVVSTFISVLALRIECLGYRNGWHDRRRINSWVSVIYRRTATQFVSMSYEHLNTKGLYVVAAAELLDLLSSLSLAFDLSASIFITRTLCN